MINLQHDKQKITHSEDVNFRHIVLPAPDGEAIKVQCVALSLAINPGPEWPGR